MRYYVLTRLLIAIPTLILLLTSIFFIMHVLPGDPVTIMYGDKYPTKYVDQIRHNLGLDRPILDQYVSYITDLSKGNMGISMVYQIPVSLKISYAVPTTVELAILSLLFSSLIALPLGIIAAVKRDGIFDHVSRILMLYIHSNPGFWVALLFQIIFGLILGWFPITGRSPPDFNLQHITGLYVLDSILTLNLTALLQSLKYLALPVVTIAITAIPTLSRLTRASMLNVLGEDYIVTAKAKGLPENVVIYKHALRNSLLPVITSIGAQFTMLLGGTVITERIFSLPGLGSLLMDSLMARDFPAIQGVVAVYAIVVVIMNTIIDVIYASSDPRIKY
ncbi:MAG: ABC transporter permease [Candidatus Bathyarchaeia archaeon]|jgi:peptide/nickel transport system permease protein